MSTRKLKANALVTQGNTLSLRIEFDAVPPDPVTVRVTDGAGTTSTVTASRVGSTLEWRASYTPSALGSLEHTWYTGAPATVVDGDPYIVVAPAVPAA